ILFYANPRLLKFSGPRPRAIKSIIKEIRTKASRGVREFVFFDEVIDAKHREALGNLLDVIATADLNVRIIFPGNLSPTIINQELARKMRRAKVSRIYLRCDMKFGLTKSDYTTPLKEYGRCMRALEKVGGFKPRDGSIAAMLVVGIP